MFRPLGIMHTRKQPIIHRDISLCNLLIKRKNSNGTVEIVLNDFDIAREISGTATYTKVGKEQYMAPEVLCKVYGTKADIWSAGVVLLELMTLSTDYPFYAMTKDTELQMHTEMRNKLVSNLFCLLIYRIQSLVQI